MLPSQYLALPREEKAFVIASIQIKTEKEAEEEKKMKKSAKKRK